MVDQPLCRPFKENLQQFSLPQRLVYGNIEFISVYKNNTRFGDELKYTMFATYIEIA